MSPSPRSRLSAPAPSPAPRRNLTKVYAAVLWTIVVLGPVLGGIALVVTFTQRPAYPTPQPAVGVVELAKVAVQAHLEHLPDAVPSFAQPHHTALRASADATAVEGFDWTAAATATAVDIDAIYVVSAVPAGPQRWGVRVGVVRDGRVEHWQVTVAETSAGAAVELAPTPVAVLSANTPPQPLQLGRWEPLDPTNPVTTSAARYVEAWFLGQIPASSPAAGGPSNAGVLNMWARPAQDITAVTVTRVGAAPLAADSQNATVLVEAYVVRADGAIHLVHVPLLLTYVNNRWEVIRQLPAIPTRGEGA